MSLFLNDEDPLVIDDDSKDDTVDLGPIVTATPHHHRGKSRKRHFPTRHGGAVKRKRLASPPSSSILLDNDIVVLDDEVVIPSEKPVVVTSTRIPPVPTQPDLADLILQGLDQSESVIPYEKPAPVAPKYHLPSDPDVSSYQVTSTTNQEEALEISLEVGPELLNTVRNQQRRIEDRESPMRFVFKLYASQKLKLIVSKFLEIDQSTWCLDDLQLKLHGLDVPLEHTPRDEFMVGGEALYLNLKTQPKTDPVSPVAFTPLPDKVEVEEDEEKISVILQSRRWGEQAYRMAIDKPFGPVYDAFAKRNNLNQHEIQCLSLRFDGVEVRKNQTPADLDMEDEDTVDVVIKKKR